MLSALFSFWQGDAPEALIEAVKKTGNINEVKRLIAKKHNINYIQDLDLDRRYIPGTRAVTALSTACELGDTEYARLLLEAGADPGFSSLFGTPLVSAAGHLKPDLIRLLLEHNADVNQKNIHYVNSPLIAASIASCIHGAHIENAKQCLQILLDHGADVTAKDHYGRTSAEIISESPVSIDFAKLIALSSEGSVAKTNGSF